MRKPEFLAAATRPREPWSVLRAALPLLAWLTLCGPVLVAADLARIMIGEGVPPVVRSPRTAALLATVAFGPFLPSLAAALAILWRRPRKTHTGPPSLAMRALLGVLSLSAVPALLMYWDLSYGE